MNVKTNPPSYSLFAIRAAGPSTWRLDGEWVYNGPREVITVPDGFETDGASVPRIFWWFCPPIQPRYLAAALIHDYLYSTKELTRKECDIVFYRVMIEDGEQLFRAYIMYKAVSFFGWIAWRRNSDLTR